MKNDIGNKKVLVYMLDGVRADVLAAVNAPIWRKLCRNEWQEGYNGLYSLQALTAIDVEPSSAANHVSIATGLNGAKHHILTNQLFCNYDSKTVPNMMEYLGQRVPTASCAFVYGWKDDAFMTPSCGNCTNVSLDSADESNKMLCENILKKETIPSLIFVQDDEPDHGGHTHGFYPVSNEYKEWVAGALERFANLLDAISSRKGFQLEDWLIVLCSDHGGFDHIHGTIGGHSSTVPLLFVGKHIDSGVIDGAPRVTDIAPVVYNHFGWNDLLPYLDGHADIHAKKGNEQAELLFECKQCEKEPSFDFDASTNSRAFTIGLCLENVADNCDILGNRGSLENTMHGFSLYAKDGGIWLNMGCDNATLTFQIRNSDRIDLGPMLLNNPCMVGIAFGNDIVTFYCLAKGEPLSWICEYSTALRPFNSKPWQISSCVSSLCCWNKALSPEEFGNLT